MSWLSRAIDWVGSGSGGGSGLPQYTGGLAPYQPVQLAPVPSTTSPGSDPSILGWTPPDWLQDAYGYGKSAWDIYNDLTNKPAGSTPGYVGGGYPPGYPQTLSGVNAGSAAGPQDQTLMYAAVAVVAVLLVLKFR